MAKLNNRQKRFITEYVKDHNATQAAIRAGYSERTAYSQGARLLKHVDIKKEISNLQNKIRDENIAEAKDIEEFLSLAMNGEIEEEVIVTENVGDFQSEARIMKKQLAAKDRIKAAELLGKRYSLFTDNINANVEGQVVFIDDISDEDE